MASMETVLAIAGGALIVLVPSLWLSRRWHAASLRETENDRLLREVEASRPPAPEPMLRLPHPMWRIYSAKIEDGTIGRHPLLMDYATGRSAVPPDEEAVRRWREALLD